MKKSKKLLALLTALSISATAFAGLATTAFAEGEYYTQDFEGDVKINTQNGNDNNKTWSQAVEEWSSFYYAAGLSAMTDSNPAINKYVQFQNAGQSGTRTSYFIMPEAAATLDENQQTVIEFDFKMGTTQDYNEIVIVGDPTASAGNTIGNDAYKGTNYILKLHQDMSLNGFYVNDNKTVLSEGYPNGGAWAHAKAVVNYTSKSALVTITSLDGETTYIDTTQVPIGATAGGPRILFLCGGRNGRPTTAIDNYVSRKVMDGDITGTYYSATFSVDGKETVLSAKEGEKIDAAGIPETTKTGYIFDGWSKDGDTDNLLTTETVAGTPLTANVTYEAVYHKNPDYIEPMVSVEFTSFPTNGIPEMGADANTFADNQIAIKLNGEIGGDLIGENGEPVDSRIEVFDVEWQFKGFRTLVSDNGNPTTSDTAPNSYCDSYAEVVEDETNPTKVNFKLKQEAFNFYGEVAATVTYGKDEESANTITISKPMAIVPTKDEVANQFLPKPGYVADFTPYADDMVGYNAVVSDNRLTDEIVTGGWTAWGSQSGRSLVLMEEEGKKYLASKGGGSGTSNFATVKLDTAPTGQVIISQDVRFQTGGSEILFKTANPTTWNDNATTMDLKFTGSAITMPSGAKVADATTGTWYHIVMSCDVTSLLWYAKVYDMENKLLGESDPEPFVNAGSTAPVYLSYRTPDGNTSAELDFNNVKVYVPTIQGDLTTSISNDTLIIPSDKVDTTDGIKYADGTVTVNKADANDGDKAVLIHAVYAADGSLTSAKSYELTFNSKTATQAVTAGKGSKFMLWDSLDGMKPIFDALETDGSSNASNTAALTVEGLSDEGYPIIGAAEWTVVDSATGEASEFVKITPDPTDSHKATLEVLKGAASGEYKVTVSMGGKTKDITINVTGTQESVKFTTSTSSIAIPMEEGASEQYKYEAAVVDANSKPIEGKTVTYAMYDKNNQAPLANTDAISFDAATATLTVTSAAEPTVVYIRATGTNSENQTISRSIAVNIHGLSFDFGSNAAAEGYTAVTPTTSYTETSGYGIVSGSPTVNGEGTVEDADADSLKGAFKFQAKVVPNKVYDVTINYSGTATYEAVNRDLTGIAKTNASKSAATYTIAVTGDGILDIDFNSSSEVSSIVIEKQADKQPGGKPNVFSVGDSTEHNHGSWGYQLTRDFNKYTDLNSLVTWSSQGQGSQNLGSYYNNGNLMERVLINIKPGDYVTIGNMGTNGMGSDFEGSFNAYVDACEAMGAKVILNSYSPHGAMGDYANCYDAETHTFTGYRQDAYDVTVRKIYEERSTEGGEKYDPNVIGFVDIGKMADAAFNAYVADWENNTYNKEYKSIDEAAAELKDGLKDEHDVVIITGSFKDHNHYGDSGYSEMAGTLMLEGYREVGNLPGADGIVKTVTNIIKADLAKAAE